MIKKQSVVKNWALYNQKLKKSPLTCFTDEESIFKIKPLRFNQGKNTFLMIDSSGLEMYECWPNGQQENVDTAGTKCGESYI